MPTNQVTSKLKQTPRKCLTSSLMTLVPLKTLKATPTPNSKLKAQTLYRTLSKALRAKYFPHQILPNNNKTQSHKLQSQSNS
jgi:hypothetical protein